jgi:hypothetical protein
MTKVRRALGSGTNRGGKRGSALVIAVIMLGTLLVLSSAFLRFGLSSSQQHSAALDQSRAFYIAEAGIAEAGLALRMGKTGNVASQAQPGTYGNGLLWVTATDLGDGEHQLDSVALCHSGRAAIRAVVHAESTGDPVNAVMSDLPLIVGSNVMVDSYNPNFGTYAAQPKVKIPPHNDLVLGTKGTVGSNQGIILSSGDRIYGDATPGPTATITGLGGNTFATGSTLPGLKPIPMPPVVVPSIPSSGVKLVNKTDTPAQRTIGPGDFHYTGLTVNTQAALTLKGPAKIVLDAFLGTSGCSLKIDASAGPVEVFFTGPAAFVSNMNVTSSSPTAQSVTLNFSSALPVDLKSNANFIGTIYAPLAKASVSSNWIVYGSVSAHQVQLASNSQLHFDETLLAKKIAAGSTLTLRSWQRIPLPDALLGLERTDPYTVLGLKKGTLAKASDSYE